jgi:hypothetical protein
MLEKIKKFFIVEDTHFQIRYNTKNNGDGLFWRVLYNGKERLASSIDISGHIYGEESWVDGERKMNMACDGRIEWLGDSAVIYAKNMPRNFVI